MLILSCRTGKGRRTSIRKKTGSSGVDSLCWTNDSACKSCTFASSSQAESMFVIYPLRYTLILILATIAASAAAEPPKEPEAAKETVKLTVDYGDGVQKVFASVPWTKETTVFAALEAAAKHPRGFKLVHQGKGETVLVTAIDDLKNEGRGRNWLYEVNGKLGDRSCAVMPLKAGDSVLWRFGKYQ